MKPELKRKIFFGSIVIVLILTSFFLFKYFSISSKKILTYPIELPQKFISITTESGVSTAVKYFILDFLYILVSFIPLSLAFGLLALYGSKFGEDKKFGVISVLIPSLIGLGIVGGISLVSLLFSLGIILSGILATGLSEIYFKELKKWKRFRIGSHTVGRCFLIINITILLGLFLTSFLELDYYTSYYRSSTKSIIKEFLPSVGTVEDLTKMGIYQNLPEEQKQLIEEQYRQQLEQQQKLIDEKVDEILNSNEITALLYLSILAVPFLVFSIFELFTTIFFSLIGGLTTRIGLTKKS